MSGHVCAVHGKQCPATPRRPRETQLDRTLADLRERAAGGEEAARIILDTVGAELVDLGRTARRLGIEL